MPKGIGYGNDKKPSTKRSTGHGPKRSKSNIGKGPSKSTKNIHGGNPSNDNIAPGRQPNRSIGNGPSRVKVGNSTKNKKLTKEQFIKKFKKKYGM